MADNVPVVGGVATFNAASDEVSYSGDTSQVQLCRLVFVSGSEGSKTVAEISTAANGLFTDVKQIVPGTGATNLGKAEDAPHTSGDTGVMALAVRNDAGTALAGTTGDYIPLTTDSSGALRVVGSSGTTQYAEDLAHVSGDAMVFAGFIRRDTTPSSSSGTAGDYSAGNVDANGRLYTNTTLYDATGTAVTASTDYLHDGALTVATTAGPALILRASSAADAVVSDQDAVLAVGTLTGKQVVLLYANSSQTWSYAAVAGGIVATTTNTAKAAAGAGIYNYVTKAHVMNSHQTIGTEVVINDGVSGTTLFRGWAQFAGGGFSVTFDPPLKGTANTLIEVKEVTATATAGVLVNLQGFVSKD